MDVIGYTRSCSNHRRQVSQGRRCILVCQHESCCRNGAEAVLAAFQAADTEAVVTGSPCAGQCNVGPTVRVMPDETWYCRVRPEDVEQIMAEHVKSKEGQPVKRLLHPRFHPQFW
jgi:(2Fe-2S) ferredoxin